MAPSNLKNLVGRLTGHARRALEAAAGACLSRGHYNVEMEHWLQQMLDQPGTELAAVLRHEGIDLQRSLQGLESTLRGFKTGNTRPPALSPEVVEWAREAWLVASIECEEARTSTGHLLWALLANDFLGRRSRDSVPGLADLSVERLRAVLPAAAGDTPERKESSVVPSEARPDSKRAGGKASTPNLDQFTIDLTERAAQGKIDPVLGRDSEIRQVIDILSRRRQNNPILTGEPGVGKTAVAEGFALRVSEGAVPPALQGIRVLSLDLTLLQAGAGVKGEFENRLKGVIQEVQSSSRPLILFIDEAHTMIGAGGPAGQGDAANLLKPALARGELRTIAATTWSEYKKYFEKDAALARRFQVVKVEEPTEATAITILRGIAPLMEKHHGVSILDGALVEAVKLGLRYLAGRQLPDKAVSLLDTACARVSLSRSAVPPLVDEHRQAILGMEAEKSRLQAENAIDSKHGERIAALDALLAEERLQLAAIEERWQRELALVKDMLSLDRRLRGSEPIGPGVLREDVRTKLDGVEADLRVLQGEEPLVHPYVTPHVVAEVLGAWTGIPVGRMVADELRSILELEGRLKQRVVGQDHALGLIAKSIRTSRANLKDPGRPIGVFMLAGTSGVGKTETAIALAEELYGGEQNMTVINMSEFKEEHKVSLLLGSPPGYVGFGEGGVLTEAVRRRPYSVVLLDELEKAHPGVQEIFYQVFDKGMLKDGEGRDIDFRNTVIFMTTNAGTETITSVCADPDTKPDAEGLETAIRAELLRYFKPAFLGRCQVLPYFPLEEGVLAAIIALKLSKIGRRIEQTYSAKLEWSPAFAKTILSRCREVETGARTIDHLLSRTILPDLAVEFLERLAAGTPISRARLDARADGTFEYLFT